MAERRRYAAVIGPSRCDDETARLAAQVGAGLARVAVVASADVVVAVGREWGTLSEIGLAGVLGRPVVLLASWRLEHEASLPAEIASADSAEDAVAMAAALPHLN